MYAVVERSERWQDGQKLFAYFETRIKAFREKKAAYKAQHNGKEMPVSADVWEAWTTRTTTTLAKRWPANIERFRKAAKKIIDTKLIVRERETLELAYQKVGVVVAICHSRYGIAHV